MIVDYIQKDITLATQEHIGHGVNCQNQMNSGVAKALFTKWPQVKSCYHHYCQQTSKNLLLGSVDPVFLQHEGIVWNMFTQYHFGYDGKLYLDYTALSLCLYRLIYDHEVKEIAMPKIGCGLAGGDWDRVSELIDHITKEHLNVYIYYK